MKGPALVAVDAEPAAFAALFAAAAARGARVGWLDLRPSSAAAASPPVDAGAAKSVSLGDGRVVAIKRVAGPSVLRDLLREHFLGCAVVLVRGLDGSPRLVPDGERFRLAAAAGRERQLDAEGLVAELCRPRHRQR